MQVALIADVDPEFPPHLATEAAVRHAAAELGIHAEPAWIGTEELAADAPSRLAECVGIWIAPGSPYRSLTGALAAIRLSRERGVPLLGTCGGFQHVVIEYARYVLGFSDAAHAEYDPYASQLFISPLACSLVGKTMQVRLVPGSRAANAYGSLTVDEDYYCNFGINPAALETLFELSALNASRAAGSSAPVPMCGSSSDRPCRLAISGADQDGEPRVIEIAGHPFFVGTLFVPQMRSREGSPHPLVRAWLAAAAGRVGGKSHAKRGRESR